ncbi:unnamed protein product [Owenia fusiformis]|uniref:Uncharacterized protein n=1 Tax=Owenia fusiformis TaxID=6347 RepID=A0A8J1UYV1_OWEFU|nr:unnamed protein product [Owenia fusiformis]
MGDTNARIRKYQQISNDRKAVTIENRRLTHQDVNLVMYRTIGLGAKDKRHGHEEKMALNQRAIFENRATSDTINKETQVKARSVNAEVSVEQAQIDNLALKRTSTEPNKRVSVAAQRHRNRENDPRSDDADAQEDDSDQEGDETDGDCACQQNTADDAGSLFTTVLAGFVANALITISVGVSTGVLLHRLTKRYVSL